MGRPLIATDAIGTRDYIADGETGLMVPPRDPAALAAAIERLWGDEALRARLGGAAGRFAGKALSDEGAAQALKAILDELR